MDWTNDTLKLNEVFEKCFLHDSRFNDSTVKSQLCSKFVTTLTNNKLNFKDRLINATYIFDNKLGSYSREKFFEICFDENLLTTQLLTDLYLSVHTQARPFAWFDNDKMNCIFEKIETPFTCFEAKDKFQYLEEKLKIYRGLREKPTDLDNCGFCWSLEKYIAFKFATGDGKIPGYIITGWVEKEKILGYVLARDEYEIIVKSSNVTEKEIENTCC